MNGQLERPGSQEACKREDCCRDANNMESLGIVDLCLPIAGRRIMLPGEGGAVD